MELFFIFLAFQPILIPPVDQHLIILYELLFVFYSSLSCPNYGNNGFISIMPPLLTLQVTSFSFSQLMFSGL